MFGFDLRALKRPPFRRLSHGATNSKLQQRRWRLRGTRGMAPPPPNSDLSVQPSVNNTSGQPVYTLTATGGASSGYGPWGPNSVGSGYYPTSPAGVKSVTGGIQELLDYIAHLGLGVIEVAASLSFKGQVIFRNGATVRGNNYTLTNTSTNAQCPLPFLTDVDSSVSTKTDLLQLGLSADSIARTDTVLNAPGATSLGASPYTFTNSTAYYLLVTVMDGTVSSIANNGNACANAYGIFAVAPATTLEVWYTAGAGTTPTMVQLGAGMTFGPGSGNNYDVSLGGTNGGNGMQGCGWVNSAGVDLQNCAGNHFESLIVTSQTGYFAYRWLGAGGANNDAFVDNDLDSVTCQGFATGGLSPGYGMTFAYHTDSNRVGNFFPVPNSAAAAGSFHVAFNDLYFSSAAATDVKVNANSIEWLMATPNAAGANCSTILANGSGVTSGSGGQNVVRRFERVAAVGAAGASVTLVAGALLKAKDCTIGKLYDWDNGQTNNQLGTQGSVFSSGNTSATNTSLTVIAAGFNKQFTPVLTGKVLVIACGVGSTATAVAKCEAGLYYNTSSATAGSVWTGSTILGSQHAVAGGAAGSGSGLSFVGLVTLTVGQLYYFDLQYYTSNSADAASITNFDFVFVELPA